MFNLLAMIRVVDGMLFPFFHNGIDVFLGTGFSTFLCALSTLRWVVAEFFTSRNEWNIWNNLKDIVVPNRRSPPFWHAYFSPWRNADLPISISRPATRLVQFFIAETSGFRQSSKNSIYNCRNVYLLQRDEMASSVLEIIESNALLISKRTHARNFTRDF